MKLYYKFRSESIFYNRVEPYKWAEYIDKSADPKYINEMFNMAEIDPNIHINLIEHPQVHKLEFIKKC